MNSEELHQQSQRIAERLLISSDDLAERVDWAYRMIFGRPAQDSEIQRADEYVTAVGSAEEIAWAGYVRAMIGSNAFMFVD